jgi:hypothetical protein
VAGATLPFTGGIKRVIYRNLAAGAKLADVDFTTATAAATSFAESTAGATVTINSTNAVPGLTFATDDYVQAPDATDLAFGAAMTVFGVVKIATPGATAAIVDQYDTNAARAFAAFATTGGKLRAILSADGGSTNVKDYTGSQTFADNTWRSFAITYAAGTTTLYVNALADGSPTKTTDNTVASLFNTTANLMIGASLATAAAANNLTGSEAAIALFPTALSAFDVGMLHNYYAAALAADGITLVPAGGVLGTDQPWAGRWTVMGDFSPIARALATTCKIPRTAVQTAAGFTARAFTDFFKRVVDLIDFGGDPTGVLASDDALDDALLYLHSNGGGVLNISAGGYKFTKRHIFPYTVDSGEAGGYMNSIVIRGHGSARSMSSEPLGGTILKFYDSDPVVADGNGHTPQAYFDIRGRGTVETDSFTMLNSSTSSTVPFIRTTTPVPFIHNCAFFGRTGRTGTSCDQDAIVVGGTTRVTSMGDNGCYFGYGGSVKDCYFNRVRECVRLNTNVNSFVTECNTVGLLCGGGASDAAMVGNSGTETGGILADSICYANTFRKNIIEMVGYKYGIDLRNYAAGNKSFDNDFWDAAAYSPAYCHKISSTNASFIEQGTFTDSCTFVSDGGFVNNWTRVGGTTNRLFALTLSGTNPLIVDGIPASGGGILVKSNASAADYWRIGAPSTQDFTLGYEPNGSSTRTLYQLTRSVGDNSTYNYVQPPTAGGNSYYTSADGGVGLRANGTNANLCMFGDDAAPTAFQYYGGLLTATKPLQVATYAVASLPTASVRAIAYASNGRKTGEGAGVGTGTLVYADGTAWRRVSDDSTVLA